MIIKKPGPVTDRIHLLGREESNVYLVKGHGEYFLLGGGMATIIPEVTAQIRELKIDVKKITRLVILHTHFDHCGAIPYLKKKWPWARVTASRRGRELLSKPKVLETNAFLNRAVLEKSGLKDPIADFCIDPFVIDVQKTVDDGEVLDCGGLDLEILEVPGHSSCSIAVYVPTEKALFASDAAGIAHGRHIMIAANSDFDQYQQSLSKMAKLDVAVYAAEHYGARTGQKARDFLKRCIRVAADFRKILNRSLKRTGDVHTSTEQITKLILADNPDHFLPPEVIAMVVRQMLTFLERQRA